MDYLFRGWAANEHYGGCAFYSHEGILTEWHTLNTKGELISRCLYETSENCTTIYVFNFKNVLTKKTVIFFKYAFNPPKTDYYFATENEELYDAQLHLIEKSVIKYDKKMNRVKEETYGKNNLTYSFCSEKDMDGNLVLEKIIRTKENKILEFHHEYFPAVNGLREERTRVLENNKEISRWWKWSDEFNDVVKEKSVLEKQTTIEDFHYERDKMHNWISKKVFTNGELTWRYEREIEYYS